MLESCHQNKEFLMGQPAISRPAGERRSNLTEIPARSEAYSSGVSWPAVIGGAFVSAALGLTLLTLGTGLGFSSVSPWSNVGASASTITKAAIVWLILTQIMASSMGGYLAGRLRTKWTQIHTDEVYFRDTAHGFLVWAVGLVITASVLVSTAATFAGERARASATSSTTANSEAPVIDPNAYFVDLLLRANPSSTERADVTDRGMVQRTFDHALGQRDMPPADRSYLAQVVAARTGMNEPDAEKRVSDVFEQSQSAADKVRSAIARFSLWLFVALLCGAFCASYAGTIGGRQRDHVPV
jgi:hypothetical protein